MSATQFDNVTAVAKANVYFEGKVVSHTLLFADGSKKTLGIVYPGEFHFATAGAERMDITDGHCKVRLDGGTIWLDVEAGGRFDVPANSGFDILVGPGMAQYVCSFL
jgi:purine/pyrimidine-nucleoside phosphorylase